jgi:formylglycine-generating enzyme required for sulfatase activity
MRTMLRPHWPSRAACVLALALLAALPAAQAKRLALLIGNQNYLHEKKLAPNPGNDVQLLGRVFRDELKFDDVQVLTDQSAEGIERAVDTLARKGQGADVLVFYYSGHGMKSPDRRNFLLPVEARIELPDTYSIKRQAVAAEDIRDQLKAAGATVSLLLLDACRDGPGGGKSGSKGLARMEGGRGLLIGYATEEDRVADNGNNGNSPYALGLAAAFRQKYKPILAQLDEASDVVRRLTGNKQEPTRDGNLRTDAYLVASLNPEPVKPGGAPGGSLGLDLADLERADQQDRANRTQWAQWQQAMQAAFDKVGKLSEAVQAQGWERFIKTYGGQSNPYSNDDKALLTRARQALAALQARVQQPQQAAATSTQAGTRPGSTFKDCADCPEMVVIPAGSFDMGSPASESGRSDAEGPQHRVNVGSFALGKFELTQGQWRALMGNNPSRSSNCGDDCPVEQVSWEDAQQYINKLNQKTGQSYRLPSEAEWEYAARAGTSTRYAWGDTASHEQANYGLEECCLGLALGRDRWQNTAPVSQFPANGFGLYDMHGNVYEWVQDIWHDLYQGAPADGSAWTQGGDAARRVLRGGSWYSSPQGMRAAARGRNDPSNRNESIGLRVARTVP